MSESDEYVVDGESTSTNSSGSITNIPIRYNEKAEEKAEAGGRHSRNGRDSRNSRDRHNRLDSRDSLNRLNPPPLKRQDTFVVEDDSDGTDNGDLLDGTLHAGGIRALLENANSKFVFPDEVKAYISSHFQMIRDENEGLRKSLESKTKKLDRMREEHTNCRETARRMEEAERKLDKEKMKTKMMSKRLKEEDQNITWFGLPSVNDKENRGGRSSSQSDLDAKTVDRKEIEIKRQLESAKKEVDQLKATLLRELGSRSAVEAALNNSSGSGGSGGSTRLSDLESSQRGLPQPQTPAKSDPSPSNAKVIEVERDRLAEYVQVLGQRLTQAEDKVSNSEFTLRDERRKTAKLERMLEQAHVMIRDNGLGSRAGSGSSPLPGTPIRVAKDQSDEIAALVEELEEAKLELDEVKARRENDLEIYLKGGSGGKGKKKKSNRQEKEGRKK